jgi:hypothetical protein
MTIVHAITVHSCLLHCMVTFETRLELCHSCPRPMSADQTEC